MKKISLLEKVLNILGLIIVFVVIFLAFFYKQQIEKYAMGGYFGVLVSCFASTATILLPAPGIFVVIQYAQLLNPVLVVILGGIGTASGELIGYILGRAGKNITNINIDNKILRIFEKHPYVAVFIFSVLPLPLFDVIGVVSGMSKVNVCKFWLVCLLGKIIKMSIYILMVEYIKDFIK